MQTGAKLWLALMQIYQGTYWIIENLINARISKLYDTDGVLSITQGRGNWKCEFSGVGGIVVIEIIKDILFLIRWAELRS